MVGRRHRRTSMGMEVHLDKDHRYWMQTLRLDKEDPQDLLTLICNQLGKIL
jgi:hypothetical protein